MLASGRLLILALSLLAAAGARASPAPAPAHRRGAAHDAWQRLIAEYSRAAAAAGHHDSWGYPFSLGTSPVLLLPIPVPVPAHHQAKSDCDDSGERDDSNLPDDFLRFGPAASAQQRPRPFGAPTQQAGEPFYRPGEPYSHSAESYQASEPYPLPAEPFSRPTDPYPRSDQAARLPTKSLYNPEISFDYKLAPNDLPQIEPVSSATLIELFRAQTPKAPEMPPALLQPEYRPQPAAARADFGYLPPEPAPGYDYPVPLGARFARQLPADEPPAAAPAAPPRYPTSLMVKGELTAYKADYTEPYTAWSDGSGAARVDFHGGGASAYRSPQPDGSVRHVLMRVRRGADGAATRRCMMGAAPAEAESKAPPALPDLKGFLFGGFKRMADGKRAEVWRRSERAAAGGDARARRHELTLLRQDDDTAMPLTYSVTTDSAMLGAGSDRFEHRYSEVRPGPVPAAMLSLDLDAACADVAAMNASQPMQMSLLDPLREFVRPATDALMLDVFTQFTKDFSRKYVDKAEEVLRMNVLTQTWRWLQSFNRQGATFEVGLNFLADRLDAELEALRGVVAAPERLRAELFPHAAADTARLAAALPEQFDWRDLGAVTPPRYQGTCSSCWAFAVTAAAEGALHAAAGRLVPLAEQALVDCGNRTGAHGCGGTWPSFAYDYLQETGLPARAAYSPYAEKVLKCRDDEVPIVTRISAHVNVTSESIPALKVAIRQHAPTVVIIDATAKSFIFYKKGILYDDRCGKKRGQLNHAVTAVGWGSRDGAPHFTVKNSWSDKWGEAGFARLQAPANTCGVLALPSYPRLERGDVLPAAAAAAAAAPAPPPAAR